jgi:integrase
MPKPSTIPQAFGCTDVTIAANPPSYRLIIGRHLWEDNKPRYVPLNIRIDSANARGRAQQRQLELQHEINVATFDRTLNRYKHWKTGLKHATSKALTLGELWDSWCEYKKPLIASSTYKQKFRGTYLNCIYATGSELELNAQNAIRLRDWLIQNRNKQDRVNLVNELDNAVLRAINDGSHIGSNPFMGMGKTLKDARSKKIDNRNVDEIIEEASEAISYSIEEAKVIIRHFELNVPAYCHFVFFRFYTGMRLGESVELRWEDISSDFKKILIRRSYDKVTQTIKTTKTGKHRTFNLSDELRVKLFEYKKSLPQYRQGNSNLIFTNSKGSRIDTRNFLKIWDRAMAILVADGSIGFRLPPKNSRHSFVTIARLGGADSASVANQVGHSVKTEDAHYLDRAASRDEILSLD